MATGRALTAEDRFPVGSVTKTFIGTIVLQLAAEGTMVLDDPVEAYMPSLLEDGADVTPRRLMNHTSGIPDLFRTSSQAISRSNMRRVSLVALAQRTPHDREDRWAYSNTNYVVLGLTVEAVTHTRSSSRSRLASCVRSGFRSTGTRPTVQATAHGSLAPSNPILPSQDSQLVDVTDVGSRWAWPAVVSNAHDVAGFLEALLDGSLVPPDSLDAMLEAVESDWSESDGYGLGIERISSVMGVSPLPPGTYWGHLGLGLGHTVVALASRDGRHQAVVMVNQGMIDERAWKAVGDATSAALSA